MSKKKERTGRRRTSAALRKAVSATVIAGALLAPATASGNDKSSSLTVGERIANVQQAIKNRLSKNNDNLDEFINKASYEESATLQWGNWGNWTNWGNWGNWSNWNNWGNWGNWANTWGNWGNF